MSRTSNEVISHLNDLIRQGSETVLSLDDLSEIKHHLVAQNECIRLLELQEEGAKEAFGTIVDSNQNLRKELQEKIARYDRTIELQSKIIDDLKKVIFAGGLKMPY